MTRRLSLPSVAIGQFEVASQIMDMCREGLLVTDLNDPEMPLVHVNRAFESITGYSRGEALGQSCRFLQGDDRSQPEIALLREAIQRRGSITVTLRNYRKDGELFWNELSLAPIFDGADKVSGYVGLMRDVSESWTADADLDDLPHLDRLTALIDRDGFVDRIDRLNESYAGAVLVALIDIWGVHDINSSYGYDAGDVLIGQLARRLSTIGAEFVARMGGDKFAVAFRLPDQAHEAQFLARVSRSLERSFTLPGVIIKVRFAMGYVVGAPGAPGLVLARQATSALRNSKTTLLRSPRRFDSGSEQASRQRTRLTNELQQAVANEDFLYHYQPQVELRTGRLVGVEALMRWNHPRLGLRYPGDFIALAEQTGLILDMEASGLRKVAAFAARANAKRKAPLTFSINISPLQLTHGDLVELMNRVLADTGAEPAWLTLELTESLLTENTTAIRDTFQRLRAMGLGLSIDDFGTGYSSFRYLESFPISEIKIDQSFVRDLLAGKIKRRIAGVIIALGEELGVNVVAEGIETEAERTLLQGMNCPLGQGHLFSPPIDEEKMLILARASSGQA